MKANQFGRDREAKKTQSWRRETRKAEALPPVPAWRRRLTESSVSPNLHRPIERTKKNSLSWARRSKLTWIPNRFQIAFWTAMPGEKPRPRAYPLGADVEIKGRNHGGAAERRGGSARLPSLSWCRANRWLVENTNANLQYLVEFICNYIFKWPIF